MFLSLGIPWTIKYHEEFETLQYAISNSDNTACDVPIRLVGAPKTVEK